MNKTININRLEGINERIRILSIFILCFQGFGIRIFQGVFSGAIVLWMIVLLILNWHTLSQMPKKIWIALSSIILFSILFDFVKGAQTQYYLYCAWISGVIVMSNYINAKYSFVSDLSKFTNFCMWYSLVHIPIMFLFKEFIFKTSFGMSPSTFMYLLYFNNSETLLPYRIQGFCWEPSCWNLLLNINLLLAFYLNKSKSYIAFNIIAILFVFSTTGLMTMLGVIAMSTLILKGFKVRFVILGIIALLIVAPFVINEFNQKMGTGSGVARQGDLAIAAAVIQEHPWVGVDPKTITSNPIAIRAREETWDVSGDYEGYMEQGMINSFAALIVKWGVPLFLIIIICLFKTPLFNDKVLSICFAFTLCLVLNGTPIANTGFFYMFVLSNILMRNKNKGLFRKNETIKY